MGFRVRAVILDQGSTNRSANIKFGVTYIINEGQKIYMNFDICHIIKNIKNTIMKTDISTPDRIVSGGVVKELYNYQKH